MLCPEWWCLDALLAASLGLLLALVIYLEHSGRLPDLVKEILAHTPKTHEDHINLAGAYRQVQCMVHQINAEVHKMEEIAKVGYYDSHMIYPEGEPRFKLSHPGRNLVREVCCLCI